MISCLTDETTEYQSKRTDEHQDNEKKKKQRGMFRVLRRCCLDAAIVVLQIAKKKNREDKTSDFHEEKEQRNTAQRFRILKEDISSGDVTTIRIVLSALGGHWFALGCDAARIGNCQTFAMSKPIGRLIHSATLPGALKAIPLRGDGGVVVFAHRIQQCRTKLIFRPVSEGEGDDRANQLQKKNDDQ